MDKDTRNMIGFGAIALILIMAYQFFLVGPEMRRESAAKAQAQAQALAAAPTAMTASGPAVPVHMSRDQALARTARIVVDSPTLTGSIALKGARFDDLHLKAYHTEVSPDSPLIELLRPEGTAEAYYAEARWIGANLAGLPDSDTLWTQTSGGALSPGKPVILTYATPTGIAFTRTIAVDDKSMFTITDTVANRSGATISVTPYAAIKRQGLPMVSNKSNLVHEGAIGMNGDKGNILLQTSYKDWKNKGEKDAASKGGWLGVTDKYWMTAFVPEQNEAVQQAVRFKSGPTPEEDVYEAGYLAAARNVAVGGQTTETTHLFAGAKKVPVLEFYKKTLGIPRFDDAVDWGWFWPITKPIFYLLELFFHGATVTPGFTIPGVANFGIAILMLTVVIRALTFPLANRGFEMGVKMKKIQPEMQAMQKRLKEDPAAQQKEMMALYAREKVNPVTGCLPMLLPIPVFYALTKVFTVTIEMYHAPFFGWIHDLSARDPTTIMNLFGLIPWDPSLAPLVGGIFATYLHLGIWPLAYGASMMLSTSMSPQTGIDPTQQMLFKLMPIFFTFILAQYAVGLLIYWTWSSLITITQQYVLMRRHKVSNPIDDLLDRFRAKPVEVG